MLDAVRRHNRRMLRQAWRCFGKAVPGAVRLVPDPEPRPVIERDCSAIEGMILGDAPGLTWIIKRLPRAEAAINAV